MRTSAVLSMIAAAVSALVFCPAVRAGQDSRQPAPPAAQSTVPAARGASPSVAVAPGGQPAAKAPAATGATAAAQAAPKQVAPQGAQPAAKSAAASGATAAGQTSQKPAAPQGAQPAVKTAAASGANAAGQTSQKPAAPQGAQPAAKASSASAAAQPAAKAAPASSTAVVPAAPTPGKPTTASAADRPSAKSAATPATAPAVQPAAKPALPAAAQSATRTAMPAVERPTAAPAPRSAPPPAARVAAPIAGAPVAAQIPAATASPARANLWQYVHPDTRFLAGLDWQSAKSTATGRMIARQLAGQGQQLQAAGPALAILDRFERVLISTTGRDVESATQQPPLVVAVEGSVDRVTIKRMMPPGTAVERLRGVDVYVPPKGQDTDLLLAVVSDRVALIGDRASLARILDAPTGTRDTALLDRAMQLAAQCEFWMVSAVPPGQASGNALPAMQQLDDIESLDLGVSLAKGLGLRANLITKNEDSAKGLATLAQLVTSMSAQSPRQSPELTAIMKSLHVKTEGAAVRIAMDVPLAQLEKGVMSVKSTTQASGKRSLESFLGIGPPSRAPEARLPEPVVAVAKPAPPKKLTIRISGLDDGPREITYEK